MHYTEGNGRIEPTPGKYEFVDQALPTYAGTVDTAEFNNAVMYEILNVLDYAGVTPEASAAADRSAGWVQLKEAIFESSAITSDAIDEVSITKLSQGIAQITSTVDTSTRLTISSNNPRLMVQHTVNGDLAALIANAGGVGISQLEAKDRSGTTYQLETHVAGDGITYTGTHPGSDVPKSYEAVFDASGTAWTVSASGAEIYTNVNNVTFTGIPYPSPNRNIVYKAWLRGNNAGSGGQFIFPMFMSLVNNSGTLEMTSAVILSNTNPNTLSDLEIVLTFDATDVD